MKIKKDGALVLSAKEVDALNVRMFMKWGEETRPNPMYTDLVKRFHEEVDKWCKTANGKARERTICYADLYDAVKDMEKLREDLRLPKKAMDGIVFVQDPHGQKFPNAYFRKGDPMSTVLRFSYSGNTFTFRASRRMCRHDSLVHTGDPLPETALSMLKNSFL